MQLLACAVHAKISTKIPAAILCACPSSKFLHSDDSSDIDVSVEQALKEVYLPESGVWIAKYPFVDRDVFLDISLDIARERQAQ